MDKTEANRGNHNYELNMNSVLSKTCELKHSSH